MEVCATIKRLFIKYREQISYLFFGVLTTAVNYLSFLLFMAVLPGGAALDISTWLAWFLSVLFAYFTNRRWVFQSKAVGPGPVAKELLSFFAARLFSGLVDYGFILLTVRVLGGNESVMKLLSNVIVILLNYLLSKLIVFRKEKKSE
ncbi:MAG: GtrA family protein [Oscillospiraceae bacterium]